MSHRTIDEDIHFLNFCSSVAFRADELLQLMSREGEEWWNRTLAGSPPGRAMRGIAAGLECDVVPEPFPPRMLKVVTKGSAQPIWQPYLFRVNLPVSYHPGEHGGEEPRPSSMKCECLVSIFGIGVKLRFAFRDVDRDRLVGWPDQGYRWSSRSINISERGETLPAAGPGAERSSADESADTNSRGDGWDIGAVCWLVADATLDALGGALSRLDRTHWKESVKSNVRRVYCEIAEKRSGNPGPDDDLFVELAQHSGTGKGGRDGAWLRDRIRRSGSGELHLFAPLGASLYLKYQSSADNRSWRSANCHRRDVGYSVLFHNLLCAQLDFLSTELSTESADEPGRETRDLRVGKIVEVAHRRMRLLADFHEKYWWLIYYSKQRKLLEKLELILSHVGSVFDDATIEAVRRSLEPTDR